jgi:hypothetical protein
LSAKRIIIDPTDGREQSTLLVWGNHTAEKDSYALQSAELVRLIFANSTSAWSVCGIAAMSMFANEMGETS